MDKRSLVFVLPAIREGRQSVQANIHTERGMGVQRNFIRHFDGDRHKPPRRGFGDACRENLALKAEGLGHIHSPQFWDIHPMIANGEFIIGQIERWARVFLALELGIAGLASSFAPLEEVLEGGCHIHESALHRALGDIVDPRKLVLFDCIKLRAQSQRRWFAACLVLLLPLSPGPVKGKASRASSTSKIIRLFRRWMEPDLVRFEHP